MKIVKIVLLILAIIIVAIQFVPNKLPENKPADEKDIANSAFITQDIMTMLKTSCFDCHSNQTHFPWYAKLAPSSWLLASDINQGRSKLNFSEWESLGKRKQISKLEDIKEEINSGDMPLKSYILIHRNSKLSADQVAALVKWTEETSKKILE